MVYPIPIAKAIKSCWFCFFLQSLMVDIYMWKSWGFVATPRAYTSLESCIVLLSFGILVNHRIRQNRKINRCSFQSLDVSLRLGRPPDTRTAGKVKDRASKRSDLSPIRVQLKLQSPDGKYYRTGCANTKSHTIIYQNRKYSTHAPDRTQIRDGSFGRRQVGAENPTLEGDPGCSFRCAGVPGRLQWSDEGIRKHTWILG